MHDDTPKLFHHTALLHIKHFKLFNTLEAEKHLLLVVCGCRLLRKCSAIVTAQNNSICQLV